MSDAFDPYYIWLGIPPEDQPPNHYRLLGIEIFEANREVIEAAANRQMNYLQEISSGEEHINEAQRLLGELSRARICLLSEEKKAEYDAQLRSTLPELESGEADLELQVEPPDPIEPPAFPGLAGGSESPAARLPDGLGASQPAPDQPTKKSRLVPIIVGAFVVLAVGSSITFYLINEANKEEQRLAQQAEDEDAAANKAAKEEADRKAEKEADRKAKEEAKRKAEKEAARMIREAEQREVKEKVEREAKEKANNAIKQMGVKQVGNSTIWQTEQLVAFDQKQNTLSNKSSAADLKEAESLLDTARKKQAELSTKTQALLTQLDEQYSLRPVPKDAATVLKLRSGAKKTLEAKGLIQVEGGKNTWTVAPIFDLKQLEDLTSQSKPKWTALEPLLNRYLALRDKSRECHKDDNIEQSLNLLGEKLNEVPSLPKKTDDTIKELAKIFLKSNKLLAEDNLYRLNAIEKKIRNLQNKIDRDNKQQSRKKKSPQMPANFNHLVEKQFNEMTDHLTLQKRKEELEKKIKANNISPAEGEEYHRVLGMMKGMHSWKFNRPDIPAITAEQVKKEIREELAKKAPELAARQGRTKKSKTRKKKSPQATLEKFQQELHDNYEKLRKDPQITLALTIVGGELPPEETKE